MSLRDLAVVLFSVLCNSFPGKSSLKSPPESGSVAKLLEPLIYPSSLFAVEKDVGSDSMSYLPVNNLKRFYLSFYPELFKCN